MYFFFTFHSFCCNKTNTKMMEQSQIKVEDFIFFTGAICFTTICCILFTSAKEVMLSPGFVSLFVNKITQKLMGGF